MPVIDYKQKERKGAVQKAAIVISTEQSEWRNLRDSRKNFLDPSATLGMTGLSEQPLCSCVLFSGGDGLGQAVVHQLFKGRTGAQLAVALDYVQKAGIIRGFHGKVLLPGIRLSIAVCHNL